MAADSAPPLALGVTRILARSFDGRSETSLDPDLRVFVTDLVRPYGLPVREDLLAEGVGHSYEELAEGLLAEALADGVPVDLLILAFDSPDVRPGAPSSLALSRSCPGTPLAFALCDQGSAVAFSALRVAAEYQRTGACRRAVVVLAEQTALHYRPAAPVDLPERHSVVVLVLDETADVELTVRQFSALDGRKAAEVVGAEVGTLGADAAVLLGSGLAAEPVPGVAAAAGLPFAGLPFTGLPFTGLWAELAERLPEWQEKGRPVLAAGFDRRLGVLSTLTLRAGP
ncbi:hypothetical protein OG618_33200 [Kitasatospora sp. NBC_01246]|uniref:hypothetical protein n=1 Tax=Kitasatospora sp. NBC_01246 TaxID=2903570 RepID=UPI002E341A96|nr:hypothetical protein [Kitasatospora sp. NBC_01246]